MLIDVDMFIGHVLLDYKVGTKVQAVLEPKGGVRTTHKSHQSAVFGFHLNRFGLNLGYVDLVWAVLHTKSLLSSVWITFELFWVEFRVC